LIHPQTGPLKTELMLPGNIQPLYTASVYARVDGYVDRRNVDIGSKVKAGQVLAVISAPEIDQQLLQARATVGQANAALLQAKAALEQANANEELARLTKVRDVPLGQEHAISQQAVDEVVQTSLLLKQPLKPIKRMLLGYCRCRALKKCWHLSMASLRRET
jgi:multidrug efflux pump subunit AcrA (membrane-fusion protein)